MTSNDDLQNNNVINDDIKTNNVRVRRVGTFTMGLSLILVGVAIIISLFSTSDKILALAKFSPLILVFIGIEILVENFIHKTEKIKYDFLSGFVCFILICGSLAASCIPFGIKYFGPEREHIVNRLSQQVYDQCYSVLKDEKISDMDTHIYLNNYSYDEDMTVKELNSDDRPNVNITLSETYETPKIFAQKCRSILDLLNTTGLRFDDVTIENENFENYGEDQDLIDGYQLDIHGDFKLKMTAEELEKYVIS